LENLSGEKIVVLGMFSGWDMILTLSKKLLIPETFGQSAGLDFSSLLFLCLFQLLCVMLKDNEPKPYEKNIFSR